MRLNFDYSALANFYYINTDIAILEGKAKVKVKVSICIAHLMYNASNAFSITNPSRQPHGHHVQPADTG